LLDLGAVYKSIERLPEALCALEEAYNVHCEWTGPADRGLQGIAIEIANLLRKTGDFEKAEYFSRVTYEMMKEHHNAAGEVLVIDSAAGSRCQILTDAVRGKSDNFSGASKYNILKDAEALAREALAEAGAGDRNLDEA
jgi:hypothetical protein